MGKVNRLTGSTDELHVTRSEARRTDQGDYMVDGGQFLLWMKRMSLQGGMVNKSGQQGCDVDVNGDAYNKLCPVVWTKEMDGARQDFDGWLTSAEIGLRSRT